MMPLWDWCAIVVLAIMAGLGSAGLFTPLWRYLAEWAGGILIGCLGLAIVGMVLTSTQTGAQGVIIPFMAKQCQELIDLHSQFGNTLEPDATRPRPATGDEVTRSNGETTTKRSLIFESHTSIRTPLGIQETHERHIVEESASQLGPEQLRELPPSVEQITPAPRLEQITVANDSTNSENNHDNN